jgi:serine/threonine protein phosphatase PrpC
MSSPALRVASRTFTGSRTENEDRIAVEQCGEYWCLVLSDGVGGHDDGGRAAQLVVERIVEGFRSRPPTDPRDLAELIMDAHDAIIADRRRRMQPDARSNMHATVVVLLIDTAKGTAFWGHVGDSRLYQWRAGRLEAITRDDSALQAVLDAGLVDEASAHKIAGRNVLMAALGSREEAVPHVSTPSEVQAMDAFLLCSDGWWNALDLQSMSASLEAAASPQEWLDAMAAQAQERADPHQDNYSAIACWVGRP